MLATQNSHALDQSIAQSCDGIRNFVTQSSRSGIRQFTHPEVDREMRHIRSGAEHIRLDQDFLRSSPDWRKKWGPENVVRQQTGAAASLQRAGTFLSGLHTAQQETQRGGDVIAATLGRLRGAEQSMAPHAHQSIHRIKEYCDHVGVTDRYTTYRHNLNSRVQTAPVRLHQSHATETRGLDWRNSLPASSLTRAQTADPMLSRPKTPARSLEERCGINTVFPGDTEYIIRYDNEQRPLPIQGIVNPIPDYTMSGRPLGVALMYPKSTEYQSRYEYPDGSKLERLPWLRK